MGWLWGSRVALVELTGTALPSPHPARQAPAGVSPAAQVRAEKLPTHSQR